MRRKEDEFASTQVRETAHHLGALVRQARLARMWTVEELAERARTSPATLKRIEAGSVSASLGGWLGVLEIVGLLPRLKALDDQVSRAVLDETRTKRARRKKLAPDLDF